MDRYNQKYKEDVNGVSHIEAKYHEYKSFYKSDIKGLTGAIADDLDIDYNVVEKFLKSNRLI